MREIKFRAMDFKDRWQYGTYYYGVMYPTSFRGHYVNDEQIDEKTIGQYTNIEDAEINGTSVFEGDIIKNCDTSALQVVYWNEDKAAWYCRYIDGKRIVSLADSIGNLNKVIGNIYEHHELLKT